MKLWRPDEPSTFRAEARRCEAGRPASEVERTADAANASGIVPREESNIVGSVARNRFQNLTRICNEDSLNGAMIVCTDGYRVHGSVNSSAVIDRKWNERCIDRTPREPIRPFVPFTRDKPTHRLGVMRERKFNSGRLSHNR